MADVEKMPRVVYLDDEIDSVVENDVEFNGLSEDAMNINLPGLCATNCSQNAVVDTTANIGSRFYPTHMHACAEPPTCDADALNDVAKGAWPPPEPYALARPSSSDGGGRLFRDGRASKERYDYAKALLKSDKELERLARKIRSEIRQSEMKELAIEAERAADAGLERFCGRPSTFWDGVPASKNQDGPSISLPGSHKSNHNNALQQSRESSRSLVLRDVGEVIPDWKDLHSHLRTHMYHRRVEESTLIFTEKSSLALHPDPSDDATRITKNSYLFFENIADITMAQLTSHSMIQNSEACGPAYHDAEDRSQASEPAPRRRLGTMLSSHISPDSTECTEKPQPSELPGLDLPNQNDHLVKRSPLFDCGISQVNNAEIVCLKEGKRALYNPQLEACIPHSSNLAANSQSTRAVDSPIERLNKLDHGRSPSSLFDVYDDDESSCPPSPLSIAQKHSFREEECLLTPKDGQNSGSKSSGFETPARLRNIRSTEKTNRNNGFHGSLGAYSTPEAARIPYEPSSIVEDELDENGLRGTTTTHEEQNFLAIPSIHTLSTARSDSKEGGSQTREVRNLYSQKPERRGQDAPRLKITRERIPRPAMAARSRKNPLEGPSYDSSYATECSRNPQKELAPLHHRVTTRTSYSQMDLRQSCQPVESRRADNCNLPPAILGGDQKRAVDFQDSFERGKRTPSHFSVDVSIRSGHSGGEPRDEKKCSELESSGHHMPWSSSPQESCIKLSNKLSQIELGSRPQDSVNSDSVNSDSVDDFDSATLYSARECNRIENIGKSDVDMNVSALSGVAGEESFRVRKASSCSNLDALCEEANTYPVMNSVKQNEKVRWGEVDQESTASLEKNLVASAPTLCNSFPTADKNFQAAVRGVMSRLSPTSRHNMASTWYLEDSDSTDYLKNYFYCVKPQEMQLPRNQRHTLTNICLEPCNEKGSACHSIGVDTVCNGFSSIFSHDEARSAEAMPASLSEHGRSMEMQRWFNGFAVSARLPFRLDVEESGICKKPALQFHPPHLSKLETSP